MPYVTSEIHALSSDNSYNAGITVFYYNKALDTKYNAIAVISGYIYTNSS